jgi:hypothetical protein
MRQSHTDVSGVTAVFRPPFPFLEGGGEDGWFGRRACCVLCEVRDEVLLTDPLLEKEGTH